MIKKVSDFGKGNEKAVEKVCNDYVSSYGFWLTMALIFSLFILMFILFDSDYKQSVTIAYIWNHTIKSDAGLLGVFP